MAARLGLDPGDSTPGEENNYYCIERVGGGIMTVRFTYRGGMIRFYGAGYWRKERKENLCRPK